MYSHEGTWSFLKLFSTFVFVGVAVFWMQGVLGGELTILVLFAIVGVVIFAGGALFAHANQKMTLDAMTKFNANDSQIDRYRMQSFKALASGESAMQRAAAQLQVLDAKRVDKIAEQRAKLLTDQAQPQQTADVWTWDDDERADAGGDDGFQRWE